MVRATRELELLALLQHTGSSTALIDLTTDPMVALYFAVREHDDVDGLLLGFNVDDRWDDLTGDNRPYHGIVRGLGWDAKVGWLMPPVISDRIVVQRSRFLVAPITFPNMNPRPWARDVADIQLPNLSPGWDQTRLDFLFAEQGAGRRSMPPVVAFLVNSDLKAYILSYLMGNYGISHNSMFPEPDGFAQG